MYVNDDSPDIDVIVSCLLIGEVGVKHKPILGKILNITLH